jgi:hypothetical protein
LRVFVDNEKVFDQNVHAGDLTVRLPVRTRADRVRVDFRWRVGRPLGPRDPRLAAARLNFLGFAAPPARLARLPGDLAKRGVDAVGVDDDGWLHRRASLNLAGGPAGILVFRADVPPAPAGSAQHVRLMVGRHVLASQDVETGELEIRRRVPAALAFRHVSVIWRVARRLGPADARKASARLTYLGVAVPRLLSTITIPHDLKDPAVFRSGVFPDGWAGKSAAFMLSGGPAGVLTVVGAVATPDQRVSVAVNGHRVLTESLRPGHVMVHARIPASAGARRIQLHFARAAPISAADPRTAAALLQRLTVSP